LRPALEAKRQFDVAIESAAGAWKGFDFRIGSLERPRLVEAAAQVAYAVAEDARKAKELEAESASGAVRAAGHEWHAVGCGPFGSVAPRSARQLTEAARVADVNSYFDPLHGDHPRAYKLLAQIALATLAGAAVGVLDVRCRDLRSAWGSGTLSTYASTERDRRIGDLVAVVPAGSLAQERAAVRDGARIAAVQSLLGPACGV
jgi:hypothetical protein